MHSSIVESKELIIADDNSSIMKTLIKLYLVQPRALHECIIVYDSDDITVKYNDLKSSVSDREYSLRTMESFILLFFSDKLCLLSPQMRENLLITEQ